MKHLIFILAFLCASLASAAASKSPATGPSGPVSSLGLVGGTGTSSNADKSIPSRTMVHSEVILEAGVNFPFFDPILMASYRFLGQITNPDSVNGTNMAGSGYIIGAGVSMPFGGARMSLVYDIVASFTLQNLTAAGSKVIYTTPSGFHLNLHIPWSIGWKVLVSASTVNFKKRTMDGGDSDFSDNPVNQTVLGFGAALAF